MPIDPKFVHATDVNMYPDLKCHIHAAIKAEAALNIGKDRDHQFVIGLCAFCVEALVEELEKFKPQKDWVEREYEQEYREHIYG